MKNLHRVVWSKGMFLTPQHFQQQDLGWDELIHFRFNASNFANWGVASLRLDEEALANGTFVVDSASGVFPDGLVFDIPASDARPLSRLVGEFFPSNQATLDVYLALPERQDRVRNFSQVSPNARPTTRWIAETISAVDETEGREEKPLELARKNFRLVFEGESLDGLSTLRIARLTRNSANQYVRHPQFVAPCLDFRTSPYLQAMLKQQVEILATRGSTLMSHRRERGVDQADFNAVEVVDYWELHTINTHLPELKHLANVRGGHPEALYLSLLRLVGGLGTVTLSDTFAGLPDYNHDDLGVCFAGLHERLRSLLERGGRTKCIVIPLIPGDRLTWSGRIPEDSYFQNSQFYLSVAADIPVSELIPRFTRLGRVCGPADIDQLVRRALTGLDLLHQPTPPQTLPVRMGNEYFRLSPNPRNLWDGVTQSRTLTVFVPTEIANPRMELLIVLE